MTETHLWPVNSIKNSSNGETLPISWRLYVCTRAWHVVLSSLIQSLCHYNDVIMGAIASQITSLTIVYSTIYSYADQRKHQSSASFALWGIHRGPVNSPHKWPVTRKMILFDDVTMITRLNVIIRIDTNVEYIVVSLMKYRSPRAVVGLPCRQWDHNDRNWGINFYSIMMKLN